MHKTAVVILNYNGKKWLEKFLPDLIRFTPKAMLVVADNGSSDGSLKWLETRAPAVRTLDLKKNWGFAEGYNRALAQIEARYYLLLNSDVALTPDWLSPLEQLLDENPQIGACQPKIKAYHQQTHFEYAGAAGGWLDAYGFPFCRGRIFDTTEADTGQYETPTAVFWASGACLMVRAALFHRLGGLDGDFFAHMEEIDLCWRIQLAGHQVFYSPKSTVYHVGGGTLQAGSPFKTYLNFRNNLVMLIKNLPTKGLLLTLFIRMSLDGIAGLRFLAQGKVRHFIAVLRSHFYLYQNLKSLRRKRKAIRELGSNNTQLQGVYRGSIVWQYFARGKRHFRQLLDQ